VVRIVIVEDQPRLLRALAGVLEQVPDFHVSGQALTAETALPIVRRARPQVVLVDLGLPGMSGVEFIRTLTRDPSPPACLVHTILDDPVQAEAALRAGARGFVVKGGPAADLIANLRTVAGGGGVLHPSVAGPLLERAFPSRDPAPTEAAQAPLNGPGPLSVREQELLAIVAKGLTNDEIAQVLGIRPSTVRSHMSHLFTKLDVGNRVEAVTEGLRRGIIAL